MELDTTDRDLLAALLEDARISQRGLAKRVGVAQGPLPIDYDAWKRWASSKDTPFCSMQKASVGQ